AVAGPCRTRSLTVAGAAPDWRRAMDADGVTGFPFQPSDGRRRVTSKRGQCTRAAVAGDSRARAEASIAVVGVGVDEGGLHRCGRGLVARRWQFGGGGLHFLRELLPARFRHLLPVAV